MQLTSDRSTAHAILFDSRRRTLAPFAVVAAGAVVWACSQGPPPTAIWSRRQISAVGAARSPALSPDGQRVAYLASDTLYVTDVSTGATRRLAAGQSIRRPAWTSEGNEVAYQSLDTIYSVPHSGGAARVLLAPANGAYAISPDGKRIAWSTATQGRSTFAIGSLGSSAPGGTLDTVGRRQLAPYEVSWSPDGQWVAIMDSRFGVTVLSSDALRESTISLGQGSIDYLVARGFPSWISWSRGGDTLYFDRRDVELGTVAAATRSQDGVWRMRGVVDAPANYRGSDFSSDRQRFASVVAHTKFRLVRFTLDGRAATRRSPVASGEASDRHYDLSPDGTTAAFVRERDSLKDVYTVSANGGVPRQVTTLNAKVVKGIRWSPDGTSIAFIYDADTSSGVGVVRPHTGGLQLFHSAVPIKRDTLFSRGRLGVGWTPDGSRLFFNAVIRRSFRGGVSVSGGAGTIELRSGRDSLLDAPLGSAPLVSPSGNEIGFLNARQTSIVRLDWRTGRRDSTPVARHDVPVRWERDGSILVMRGDSGSTEIARFSPVVGRRTAIAVIPSRCVDVFLTVDGRTAVCEEMESATEVWLVTRADGSSRPARRRPGPGVD